MVVWTEYRASLKDRRVMAKGNGHYSTVSQTISFPGCTKNNLSHKGEYDKKKNPKLFYMKTKKPNPRYMTLK